MPPNPVSISDRQPAASSEPTVGSEPIVRSRPTGSNDRYLPMNCGSRYQSNGSYENISSLPTWKSPPESMTKLDTSSEQSEVVMVENDLYFS